MTGSFLARKEWSFVYLHLGHCLFYVVLDYQSSNYKSQNEENSAFTWFLNYVALFGYVCEDNFQMIK